MTGIESDFLYKIIVVGDLATGKSSLISRYVHGIYTRDYKATLGVDFALKILQWDEDTVVRLQLWDIAGQERFSNLTRVYYREAAAALIVFDVTRVSTFDGVSKWKSDIDSKIMLPDGNPIPSLLIANKCDLAKESLTKNSARMDRLCQDHGFIGWFETSAKENTNVDQAMRFLISHIFESEAAMIQKKESPLTPKSGPLEKQGCC